MQIEMVISVGILLGDQMVSNPKASKGIELCSIINNKEYCLNLSLFTSDVLNWYFARRFFQFIEFKSEVKE